jgi:hypothetical protein
MVKPHVHRNTVVRHDVLDVARIFIDVVVLVLESRVYSLQVVTIEFVFIMGGQPRGCPYAYACRRRFPQSQRARTMLGFAYGVLQEPVDRNDQPME